MSYLRGDTETVDCIFCQAKDKVNSEETNLVVYRGLRVLAILNKYPYTNGHMLLAPAAHVSSLEDLSGEVMAELSMLCQMSLRVLRRAYNPDGFNVGVNIGAAGGAGLPDHVHMHVLPRWEGDTNFMTTVMETRIVPEELAETRGRLRDLMSDLINVDDQ